VELDGIVYFLMTINSVACASLINAIQTADGKYTYMNTTIPLCRRLG
jgi:hypothetical protein